MAVINFIPEIWAAAILEPFEKNLVYGQSTVCNRDYEGVISQMGDTVHVTSITAPTIRPYSKTTDITIEDLTDSDTALIIDQGEYFAFRVNDIDKVQAAGDFQGPALNQAGIGIRDAVDRYLAKLFQPGALPANKLGRKTVVNGGTGKAGANQILAYDVLVDLSEKLNDQSVPLEGRYATIPSKFHSALLRDDRFTRVDASGTSEGLRNGLVGRALGFDILMSNNVPIVGGAGADKDDLVISAGVPGAVSMAQQILNTEANRSPVRFADDVRGLSVYGGKVFRPEGIATATATFAAGTG